MNINDLIDTNYQSVPDLKDIKDLSEAFVDRDYLAVLNEELKTVGIVTLKDMFHHRSGLIRDCDILKPHVGPDHSLEDVIQLMKQSGTNHLPVYVTTDFKGIISLLAVAEKLMRTLIESRLNYQKVIHDVRNPISNLKGLVNLLGEGEIQHENLDTINLCDFPVDKDKVKYPASVSR